MRILYIAKHNSGGNDDEGAILHGLTSLGHEVIAVDERNPGAGIYCDADFCLMHHWSDFYSMKAIHMPKIFWYFDLVEWFQDETLIHRSTQRREWMHRMMQICQLGFCTDGDWAEKHPDKLVQLSQGMDQRFAVCKPIETPHIDLLFTGIGRGGGRVRESWVKALEERYGSRFTHIRKGIHQNALAGVIQNSKIVLAPDSPVTDKYWSNRIYLMTGMGGFVMHPFARGLTSHFTNGQDVVFYYSRSDLFDQIDKYIDNRNERWIIQAAGYRRTMMEHLYVHRCQTLIETVKERVL